MYSFGLLVVDLEIARIRLLDVFEVSDGTPTPGLRARPISDGPRSTGLVSGLKRHFWAFRDMILISRDQRIASYAPSDALHIGVGITLKGTREPRDPRIGFT
jgi:hypothetical protein